MTAFEPKTLSSWLARRAEFSPNATALSFGEAHWTYSALRNDIEHMASLFLKQGIKKGDRVALLGFQSPEVFLSLFACSWIGAIFVPLNFRLSATELELIIADCDARLLLVDADHAEILETITKVITDLNYIQTNSHTGEPKWPFLPELLASCPATTPMASVSADDIAAIVYTSGTTGTPKGVMLSHTNLWANSINWNLSAGITSNDVILVTAPPFHVSGLFVLVTSVFLMGGHVVLHRGFDTSAALKSIEDHRVTITFMVPTMILMLTQHEEFAAADLSSIRLLVVGGAPTPEPLLRLCNDKGIPVSHCYGMSECSSATTFLNPKLAIEKVNSVGLAMLLSQIKIINEKGDRITEAGLKGEICVRGDNVTSGYWGKPDTTRDLQLDGNWWRSGDIGYLDEDGYLFLSDRLKDMIISGGENVYPAEIESVLMAHPAISNAAVVGEPDAKWGESVAAVAILAPSKTLDIDELRAFCEPHLARYKLPAKLYIVKEFPLNGAGKVLKKQIRESLVNQKTD